MHDSKLGDPRMLRKQLPFPVVGEKEKERDSEQGTGIACLSVIVPTKAKSDLGTKGDWYDSIQFAFGSVRYIQEIYPTYQSIEFHAQNKREYHLSARLV